MARLFYVNLVVAQTNISASWIFLELDSADRLIYMKIGEKTYKQVTPQSRSRGFRQALSVSEALINSLINLL